MSGQVMEGVVEFKHAVCIHCGIVSYPHFCPVYQAPDPVPVKYGPLTLADIEQIVRKVVKEELNDHNRSNKETDSL